MNLRPSKILPYAQADIEFLTTPLLVLQVEFFAIYGLFWTVLMANTNHKLPTHSYLLGTHAPVEFDVHIQTRLQFWEDRHCILNVLFQISLLSIRQRTGLVRLQQECSQEVSEVGGANIRLSRSNLYFAG